MERSQKIVAFCALAIVAIVAHTLAYRDAVTAEKIAADCRAIKEPKRISGEKMIQAGYPGLPAHLRCPAKDGRGQPLKDWHASAADGGNWQIDCTYEDAK